MGPLSTDELAAAERVWLLKAQSQHFRDEIAALLQGKAIPSASCLHSLRPFIDTSGVLRVGGRLCNSDAAFTQRHPIIIHGQHSLSKLIIRWEHVRLLHASPTLVGSSLGRRYHIIGQRKAVRTITRACITCRRTSIKPCPQLMGQLPVERIMPGIVFENVGSDYAGPMCLKLGRVRKSTTVKAYVCIFVAMSVKAVHLELVSDLTSTAFIACLRRFIARRGKPSSMWSDHGTNFTGASRELREMVELLEQQKTKGEVSEFCTS